MNLPGERDAGSAGRQPCREITGPGHRDDERRREVSFLRRPASIGSKEPHALKIPARRAEYSLAEKSLLHFRLSQDNPTTSPVGARRDESQKSHVESIGSRKRG